ncbi:hypothetical protein SETIT_3G296000v2 [Setaria italica]|uniref:Uncharacterized protein n=1 Tax=Setaria italica TaxID=4555 RepID=A0A368QKD0_SETIT|nr:uncharacterized protein LOC101757661 [Setaria italica]RCV18373.1 hypothetical protein SETIT_3G296000v2 [Setaria italica]
MALNLSSGRRRWACRAASRGGKGGAGCRHFHVHHVPSQVWASPLLRWPTRFSLLPYLLVLPVLFLAVLAFLVCFGWFTLVYFVSSLWSKENDHELCVSRSANSASDGGEPRGEDGEERAVERVTEPDGDYGLSEVCVEGQEIKEVFEDGFSEEFQLISRMASPEIFIDDKEHANEEKIVKEVVMFETNKELKAFSELDDSLEKHQQVMDSPIECFLEELNARCREVSTSLNTAKLVDVPYVGEEFVANRKEMSVLCSLEILEFIDKHDTAEIVVDSAGSDFEIPEVPSSDDSAHHGILNEHRKDVNQEQSIAEISVNSVVNHNRIPEGILDEWQETQNLVTEHNKVPEDDSMEEDGKQIVSTSDEPQDSSCETVRLAGYVCENESQTSASAVCDQATSDQDCELEEEGIKNKRVETSNSASDVCDFADNHWRIIEQLDGFAREESIHKDGLLENSAHETISDEDDDRNDNCTSTGSSRRLPFIKRSPSQWWNLCGVLDVFAGGEDY